MSYTKEEKQEADDELETVLVATGLVIIAICVVVYGV
jgi:hypothetical protein